MKKIKIHDFEPELIPVKLLKREKRFITHIEFPDGRVELAHCANTGSMKGCLSPGQDALVSRSDNPERKLKYTLEALKINETWVEVNTHRTNRIFENILKLKILKEFEDIKNYRREVSIMNSRFDFMVERDGKEEYIEIKQVTLINGDTVSFPDAVTTRGQKHLKDLTELSGRGHKCWMIYIAKRDDCSKFQCAEEIDPEYGRLLKIAKNAGVNILPLKCSVDSSGIYYIDKLEVL